MKASEIFTSEEWQDIDMKRNIFRGTVTGCKVEGKVYGTYLSWRDKDLKRTDTRGPASAPVAVASGQGA